MSVESIVVVGASAGGLAALRDLVQSLPETFPAAVLIARHFPMDAVSELPAILSRVTRLPVSAASHLCPLARGHIYVSVPGRHLVVAKQRIELRNGPRINTFRPSIDALFRSAARDFRERTAGVVLSGALDDGTAGLLAIQRVGGLTIVQEPSEAEFADMPLSALSHMTARYVLPAASMGNVLTEFADKQPKELAVMSDPIERITSLADSHLEAQSQDKRRGKQSTYACPECGGLLWQADEQGPPIFRCHVGHIYGAERLMAEQSNVLERSIWYTLRTLKEIMLLSRQLSNYARQESRHEQAAQFDMRSREAERRLSELESIILNQNDEHEGPTGSRF